MCSFSSSRSLRRALTWGGFRKPCASNRGNYDALRAHRSRTQAGSGTGLRGCELDGCGRPGLLQTADPGGPRGGGAPLARPDMPEEINRLLTDQLANLLFTPSADGDENLEWAGIPSGKIHLVGNVMIGSLVRLLPAGWRRNSMDYPIATFLSLCIARRTWMTITH